MYGYKPPPDVPIRAFDLEIPKADPHDGVNDIGEESIVLPERFDPCLQSILFRPIDSGHEPLFTYSHRLKEIEPNATSHSKGLHIAFLVSDSLILCHKPDSGAQCKLDAHVFEALDDRPHIWKLDMQFRLVDTQVTLVTSDAGSSLEIRTSSMRRLFASAVDSDSSQLCDLCDLCAVEQRRIQAEPRHSSAPSALVKSASAEGLSCWPDDRDDTFAVRQITRSPSGAIKQGTLTGLVRQLLLEKNDPSDPTTLSYTLLQTVGLWASAESILNELCAQLIILAESATAGRPGLIFRTLLSAATSLLLDSKIVEGLLRLAEFTETEERPGLVEDLWQRRTKLLTIIAMDLSSQDSPASAISQSSWDAEYQSLSRSGLQAESILAIPATLFASQLHIFHQYYLKKWNPINDKSLFYSSGQKGASRNPLVFSQHKMHFMTHTILSHILCIESRPISTSQRAAICTQWIMIGIILKRSGDMTGWLATIMAICAPSVTRLKEMWSSVEERSRTVVEREWSPVMRDLFRRSLESRRREDLTAHVLAPDAAGLTISTDDIVPFYGDLCDAVEEIRIRAVVDNGGQQTIDLETVRTGSDIVSTALQSYLHFSEACRLYTSEVTEDAGSHTISSFQDCFRQLNSMPTETTDVCSPFFLEASLACECNRPDDLASKKKGINANIGTEAYIPLIFTDQLPSYRLFDSHSLLEINDPGKRPKIQSTMSVGKVNPHASGGASLRRLNSFPPMRVPATYTTGHGHLDETTRARTAASVSQWKMLKHVRDLTGVSDHLLTIANGDLVLKDTESDATSHKKRPQSVLVESRNRDSAMSRRSSMQASDVASLEQDDDLVIRPQKYTSRKKALREFSVKAGTLDRLIDLLILNINDFQGLDIGLSQEARRSLASVFLDRPQYLKTFLVSYRSYCSTSQLLEELTSRMKQAVSVTTIDSTAIEPVFPDWGSVRDQSLANVSWALSEKVFTGILEVVSTWISLSPSDLMSPASILNLLNLFLRAAEEQLSLYESSTGGGESARICNEICSSQYKRLRKQILRVRYRPQHWKLPSSLDDDSETCSTYAISANLDLVDACDTIRGIDKIVESILQCIHLEDWMICYEILESQCLEPRGFFKAITDVMSIDQDIPIQDSLYLLEHTPQGDTDVTLLEQLPMPIKRLIQLRFSITNWTICQISEAGLTMEERIARIQYLLSLVRISCVNMSCFDIEVSAISGKSGKRQIVPSLIAGAVSAGLVSPQSRVFSLCWTMVAQANGNEDCPSNVFDLLPKSLVVPLPHVPNIACPAWLIDRMLEIACYIPDDSAHNAGLINFEKRRYIYNLLQNLELVGPYSEKVDTLKYKDNPFLFLLGSPSQLLDWKHLRSVAYKENQTIRNIRIHKPFLQLVHAEQEKARRDVRYRDIVDRHIRETQRSAMRKRLDATKSAESTKRASTRSKYGMNSILRAVRPLSVAITGNWAPDKHVGATRVVGPEALPLTCAIPRGTKPSITIDLVNSIVAIHNRKENLFRIRSEDGLETFFQAPASEELDDWVNTLSLAAIEGANKRRTTIKEDARLAAIEEIPQFSPRNSVAVDITIATFGIDLPLLVRREGSSIPRIAVSLIEEVERRGLQELGIYRISGSLSTVNALKRAFDSGIPVNLQDSTWDDINAIAGLFKLWLRELPEPLMTYALYDKFLDTLKIEDYAAKSLCLKELVHQLPVPNFSMLKRLIEHLEKITDYEAMNHMYAHNLAIVFGPNILQPVPSSVSFASSMNDLGKVQTLIRNLILQCHWIFATDDEMEEAASRISSDALPAIEELSIQEMKVAEH